MDIFHFNNFVEKLQHIDQSQDYISQDSSGKFTVVTKDHKTLNTSQIADLGEKCLNLIQATSASYIKKSEMYQQLKNALRDYNQRVYNHKNIFLRIASWFGICSKAERKLQTEISDATDLAKEFKFKDESVKKVIREIRNREFKIKPEMFSEKFFYASVLDSTSVRFSELEGLSTTAVVSWMKDYLVKYKADLQESGILTDQLDSIINEFTDLEIFSNVANALSVIKASNEEYFSSIITFMKDWLVQEILDRIHGLKNPQDEVALIGGSRKKTGGHGVVYVIRFEKEIEGKKLYSFTIVNTGGGAKIDNEKNDSEKKIGNMTDKQEAPKGILQLLEEMQKKLESLLQKVSGTDLRVFGSDRVWSPILQNDINEKFILQLIEGRDGASMDDVNSRIATFFQELNILETKGTTHKLQNKGVCAVKSITCWLHQRMGDQLWRDFKVYYTEKELGKIDEIQEKYRETFAEEGKKIVQKRTMKQQRARPIPATKIPSFTTDISLAG